MMNLIALCLVFSAIFSGGIFNPSTQHDKKNSINHHHKGEDLIIKEVNRVLMVEYEREARPKENTNNYSPPPSSSLQQEIEQEKEKEKEKEKEPSLLDQKLTAERSVISGVIDTTREKMKEASSVLPNLGQGVSYSGEGEKGGHHFNAKELICDAYGKCKHKIAGAFGKGKNTVSEKAKETVEKTKEGLGKAKDSGEDAVEKAKERVYEKVREMEEAMEKAKDGVGRVKEQGKEAGEKVVEKTKEGLEKAKDSAYETGEMAMEKTKEGLSKVKEQGKETGEMAMEKTKEGLSKVKEQGKETGEMARGKIKEKAQELKHTGKEIGEKTMENMVNLGHDLKKGHHSIWDDRTIKTKWSGLLTEGTRNFSNIFHKGTQAFFDTAKHSVSKDVLCPTMGVLHLLGLATAYGISVWVTFLSSHVLAGALPRQQFGIVQSKIYPAYFRALGGSIGCALFAHGFRHPYWGFNSLQTYNMFASLGLVLLNLLYFEPRASKVMFDRMKLEKEEGRGATLECEEFVEATATVPTCATGTTTTTTPTETSTDPGNARRDKQNKEVRSRAGELNKRLKSLNTVSSLLNVLTLMALTWQLVYLGRALPVS